MAQPEKPMRPLPKLSEPDTAPFWERTQNKQFCFQQCDNCGCVVWYPRAHCTECTQGTLSWQVSKGIGTLYSFSVVRQSYHPFFRSQVPYVVAYVDLDEGPRFLTNLVEIDDPDTVKIGQRVELVWEEHETLNIPLVKALS